MRGNFGGQTYQILGRSVLGEMENSQTYYWNEFNLQTDAGETATLVFDETETTSQWRLFTEFDPEYPMTAADAASKSVGDRINLVGDDVQVVFRGSSRVYSIEGQGPEGEAVGAVAHYFNALAGTVMEVVSWTGDEVEFYHGVQLTPGMVASAFGLSQDLSDAPFASFSGSGSGNYLSGAKFAVIVGAVLVLFFAVFGRSLSCSPDREAQPVKKTPAGPPPLAVGATGTLFDKEYRITAHALVQITEVGSKWERHEYELTDDLGTKYLLVPGEHAAAQDWMFFEPLAPLIAPTAQQAAAKQVGDLVELDQFTGKVNEIFLSTPESLDGSETGLWQNGVVTYGLRGTNEYRTLLARWNAAGIQYYRGRPLPAKSAAASFHAAPAP